MVKGPVAIKEENLSTAWARAFLEAIQPGVSEVSPVTVSVSLPGEIIEDIRIRTALDGSLRRCGARDSATTSRLLFPHTVWKACSSRRRLFRRYEKKLPRLRKLPGNRLGTYFERLIAFDGPNGKINQLEHIIETYQRGNHRRSALQALVFNPALDHVHQRRRGFPCLQQVMFFPDDHGRLRVIGVYASQYLFDRAYGNYLGLGHLGLFMAQEMGLILGEMTCITGVAKLGRPKCELESLASELVGYVSDVGRTVPGDGLGSCQ